MWHLVLACLIELQGHANAWRRRAAGSSTGRICGLPLNRGAAAQQFA